MKFKYYWNNNIEINTLDKGDECTVDSNGFLHSLKDKPAYITYNDDILWCRYKKRMACNKK